MKRRRNSNKNENMNDWKNMYLAIDWVVTTKSIINQQSVEEVLSTLVESIQKDVKTALEYLEEYPDGCILLAYNSWEGTKMLEVTMYAEDGFEVGDELTFEQDMRVLH